MEHTGAGSHTSVSFTRIVTGSSFLFGGLITAGDATADAIVATLRVADARPRPVPQDAERTGSTQFTELICAALNKLPAIASYSPGGGGCLSFLLGCADGFSEAKAGKKQWDRGGTAPRS
jgi:hypothetical protein